jgi:hypothetical protein
MFKIVWPQKGKPAVVSSSDIVNVSSCQASCFASGQARSVSVMVTCVSHTCYSSCVESCTLGSVTAVSLEIHSKMQQLRYQEAQNLPMRP